MVGRNRIGPGRWLDLCGDHKWQPRALHRIGATRKFGDEDVWDYTLNARVATVEYVHFRDFANQLVYAGRVASFSETDRLREVVPRDVQVFDFAGRMLYDTPMMYLARPPGQIHIGFPYQSPEARL